MKDDRYLKSVMDRLKNYPLVAETEAPPLILKSDPKGAFMKVHDIDGEEIYVKCEDVGMYGRTDSGASYICHNAAKRTIYVTESVKDISIMMKLAGMLVIKEVPKDAED